MLLPTRVSRQLNSVNISLRVITVSCILLIYVGSLFLLSPFSSTLPDELPSENNSSQEQHYYTDNNNNIRIDIENVYRIESNDIMNPDNIEQYSQQQSESEANVTNNTTTQSIPLTKSIEDILNEQRQRIAASKMQDLKYADQTTGTSVPTPATNGKPIQSVILSTWRSGSTFFGDILNVVPNTYYYYEPLTYYENQQIRGPPDANAAVNTIRQLLMCNYTGLDDYLEFTQRPEVRWFIGRNRRLWTICKSAGKCWDPHFLNPFCRLFPFISMKLVRLRPALSESLLMDPALNVKFVLLTRDPRGIMQSRKHETHWCNKPDCRDAAVLCKDMVDDFETAKILTNKYPSRFTTIRYEELATDPINVTKKVFNFYGLPFDENVEKFLDSHTNTENKDPYSVFKNSKATAFHWMQDLSWNEIDQIQKQCSEAISVWGYKMAENNDIFNGTTFSPLLQFPFASNMASTTKYEYQSGE